VLYQEVEDEENCIEAAWRFLSGLGDEIKAITTEAITYDSN